MFKIVRREEMSQGTVVLNEIEAPISSSCSLSSISGSNTAMRSSFR